MTNRVFRTCGLFITQVSDLGRGTKDGLSIHAIHHISLIMTKGNQKSIGMTVLLCGINAGGRKTFPSVGYVACGYLIGFFAKGASYRNRWLARGAGGHVSASERLIPTKNQLPRPTAPTGPALLCSSKPASCQGVEPQAPGTLSPVSRLDIHGRSLRFRERSARSEA